MSANLMLHCGGTPATFEEVTSVDLPSATPTYRPVAHGDMVRLIEEEMSARYNLEKPDMRFGLNREGAQLFGVLTYDLFADHNSRVPIERFINDRTDINALKNYGFSICLRNSYDKTLSAGICGGVTCFICDNKALHGSSFTYLRKHTPKIWDDLVPMVMRGVREAGPSYYEMVSFQERMKNVPITPERGYEVLGLARGQGVLTPTQFNVALREWQDMNACKHELWSEEGGNAYGLFQAFTHSVKAGQIAKKIDEYVGVGQLFEVLDLSPSPVDGRWS